MTGFLHDTLEPAAFGRLCVETAELTEFNGEKVPAAFGRLCVETPNQTRRSSAYPQPPSGGCVLKLGLHGIKLAIHLAQPPSGGCVLKPLTDCLDFRPNIQPPSGGCVLKPFFCFVILFITKPAAFGRLCVETIVES